MRTVLFLLLIVSGVAVRDARADEPTAEQWQTSAELIRILVAPELGDIAAESRRPGSQDPVLADVLPPLNAKQIARRDRVRRILNYYYQRHLNSRENTPWEMMHAIIAYGQTTNIRRGDERGPKVNAISYLTSNGSCRGLQLLFVDRGRVNARKGPYVQGHYAQLLAILAQSRVPLDTPLTVEKKQFRLADLLETEKWTCDAGMELTFKLISISHYCDSDITWRNSKGETWSIPRLIRDELAAPILSNAACGGTHRLTALAYSVRNRAKQGKPIDGEWARAQQYLNQYHSYTLALQNADGSFSTEWFRRREARPDLDRRLQTSGHILEWLVYSLPADQLDHPQVMKAVDYLSSSLLSDTNRKWEIGPLGHALHALALYDSRRYRPLDQPVHVARRLDEVLQGVKPRLRLPEKKRKQATEGSVVPRPGLEPLGQPPIPGAQTPLRRSDRLNRMRSNLAQPLLGVPESGSLDPNPPASGRRPRVSRFKFGRPGTPASPESAAAPEGIAAPAPTLAEQVETPPPAITSEPPANVDVNQPSYEPIPAESTPVESEPASEDGPSLSFPG